MKFTGFISRFYDPLIESEFIFGRRAHVAAPHLVFATIIAYIPTNTSNRSYFDRGRASLSRGILDR